MDTKYLLAVGMAVVGSAAMPSHAVQAPLKGTFALPGETENVVGEMMVRETGPLTRELLRHR